MPGAQHDLRSRLSPNTGGMVVDWATDQRNASQQWDATKGA